MTTHKEALTRIAAYPFTRAEELSVEQMREIAREALAQPEQEPVGYWMGEFNDGSATLYEVPQESVFGRKYRNIPVYTTPPQRHPLTDEMVTAAARELNKRAAEACNVDEADSWNIYGDEYIEDARAVLEAAHGIKGEA